MQRGHLLPDDAVVGQVRRSFLFWDWRVVIDVGNGPIHVAVEGSELTYRGAVNHARGRRNGVAAQARLTLAGLTLAHDLDRWETVT